MTNASLDHLTTTTPVGEAAIAVLTSKLAPLFDLEARAASGLDADAVHDMRVASRRAREAIAVFAPLYETADLKRVTKMLKRVTRALGPVRDADVYLGYFAKRAAQAEDAAEKAAALFLIGHRAALRERELAAMRASLGTLDLGAKHRLLLKSLTAFREGVDTAAPFRGLAAAVLKERAECFAAHTSTALIEERMAAQHAMRIDAKHLRYAIETFSACLDPRRYKELRAHVVAYQDVLGEIHDRDVYAAALLRVELPPEAVEAGVTRDGLQRLHTRLADERAALFAQFAEMAEKTEPARLCAQLADAVL